MDEPDATMVEIRSTSRPALERLPIEGLRALVVERARRYLRHPRHDLRIALASALATLLLVAAGFLTWNFYASWRIGRIELTNDGPPLTAQIFPETGDLPLDEPLDIVTRSTLALPAGDYRMRLTAPGRLGRTYRFAVNRGELLAQTLSLDEGLLLGGERSPEMLALGQRRPDPIPFPQTLAAVELTPGRRDFVEWTRSTMIRRDPQTGWVVWDAAQPRKPFDNGHDPALWLKNHAASFQKGTIFPMAPDLDGDGTGDILWPLANSPTVLAISGKDGSMLWAYSAAVERPDGAPAVGTAALVPSPRFGTVAGEPEVIDVDRDGTPDVIATFVLDETHEEAAKRAAREAGRIRRPIVQTLRRHIVTAISGRSGKWLWTYPVDQALGMAAHRDSGSPAQLVRGRGPAQLGVLDGTCWVGLDVHTGRPQGQPITLPFVPVRPLQYADLDGDGEPEMLALGPHPNAAYQTLAAFATRTGRALWIETVREAFLQNEMAEPPPDWPLVADLDGDGRNEIVVPDSGPLPPRDRYRGVRLFDSATGQTRWSRPMRLETKTESALDHVVGAPDLDGDGTRDLVAVSRFAGRDPAPAPRKRPAEPEQLYVDALSGRDGRPLWWWQLKLPLSWGRVTLIRKPQFWGRGPDGWPLLAIGIGGRPRGIADAVSQIHPASVHVLESSTGRELHTIPGLANPQSADLDGDGLPDLWGAVGNELQAFRGQPPEIWRALGNYRTPEASDGATSGILHPTADLSGDGIADTVITGLQAPGDGLEPETGSRTLIARSGRDGRALWTTLLDHRRTWDDEDDGEWYSRETFPLPDGDFDGDGTPDVLVTHSCPPNSPMNSRPATFPLDLISGRTGRHLWAAGPLPLGFAARGYSGIHDLAVHPIEPRAKPDVVVRHSNSFVRPGAPPRAPGLYEPRLARISGRDGKVLWDISLVAQDDPSGPGPIARPLFTDLNGDGVLDCLAPVREWRPSGRNEFILKAISLDDGKLIWSHPIDFAGNWSSIFAQLAAGDLDGDGGVEVIVVEEPALGTKAHLVVKALDGRDGRVRWTWDGGTDPDQNNHVTVSLALADFDRVGRRTLCLVHYDPNRHVRVVVLDPHGRETARRELGNFLCSLPLVAVDLTGDGRDELVLNFGDRLRVLSRDLKELWSRPDGTVPGHLLIPASMGRNGVVIANRRVGLDGASGRALWAGQYPRQWNRGLGPQLLYPGEDARQPLEISSGTGVTVCRSVLPATPSGDYAPPAGSKVPPGLAREDPRWMRPLPWTSWLGGALGPLGLAAVTALAVVNIAIPLLILRLAARRRRWSVRTLMALPVAAAVPLAVYLAVEPRLPERPDALIPSPSLLFLLGTLAGAPMLAYMALLGAGTMHRRWRTVAALLGLALFASATIAAVWLWLDARTMPALDHYSCSGWYLVVVPGIQATGVLVLFASAVVGMLRVVSPVFQRPPET
jgi:hypothetical protein